MLEYREVFSTHKFDVNCYKNTQHDIRVTKGTLSMRGLANQHWQRVEDVRQDLLKLKEAGIITELRSPYLSPVVVVKKIKKGKYGCVSTIEH